MNATQLTPTPDAFTEAMRYKWREWRRNWRRNNPERNRELNRKHQAEWRKRNRT